MVLVAMTWVVCTGVVEYKVDGGGGGAGSVKRHNDEDGGNHNGMVESQ